MPFHRPTVPGIVPAGSAPPAPPQPPDVKPPPPPLEAAPAAPTPPATAGPPPPPALDPVPVIAPVGAPVGAPVITAGAPPPPPPRHPSLLAPALALVGALSLPPTLPPVVVTHSALVPLEYVPRITTFVRQSYGCDDVIQGERGWRLVSHSQEKAQHDNPGRREQSLLHPTRTIQDVFGAPFPNSDEHCCLFGLVDEHGTWAEQCARFTIAAASDWAPFKNALNGAELRGGLLGLDYDIPNKGRWTDARRDEAAALFQRLEAQGSILARPTTFYTTAGGFRLMFSLSEPVAIGGVGGLHDLLIGLVAEAFGNGLYVDVNCIDWTRIFRLSRVWRKNPDDPKDAGYPTWTADYFRQSWGRVDLKARESAPKGGYLVYNPTAITRASTLTADEIARRSWRFESRAESVVLLKHLGRAPMLGCTPSKRDIGPGAEETNWAKLLQDSAGKWLPNALALRKILERSATPTKAYDGDETSAWALGVVFSNAPLYAGIADGAEGFHRAIGNLNYALCRVVRERIDPNSQIANAAFLHSFVYMVALRSNALLPVERRRSESALYSETWRFFEHQYRKALGYVEHLEVSKSETEELDRAKALNSFTQQHDEVVKLKETLGELLVNKCPEADAWIDSQARRMYLIDCEDGTAVLQRTLSGNLRWTSPWGNVAAVASLIRDSGLENFIATAPPATPNSNVSYKTYAQLMDEYGSVANSIKASRKIKHSAPELRWDGESMKMTFIEKWGGMRTDIKPVFHEDVDGWLRALAGSEELYHHLLDWLHFYPQLQYRICALYLYGASDIGKTVLGKALRALTENDTSAPIEIASDDFHEAMVLSPLLWTEEFAKPGKDGNRSLVDLMKKLVDGASDPLNRKGKARIHVDGYWRVFISGNDNQIIKPGRDITQDTQNALIPRLMFVDATKASAAVEPYRAMMQPQQWAEKLLPEHIIWLKENHKVVYPGQRYAKDGYWSKEHDELMTTSKAGKLTMETVGKTLSDRARAGGIFKLHDHTLWVHLSALSDAVRDHVQGRDIDHEQVRQTMLQYAAAGRESRAIQTTSKKVVKMLRLNPVKLIAYFYEHQMDCDFRGFIDNEKLWREWAPAEWVRELEGTPVPPPPPPTRMPTTSQIARAPARVVPFPNIGRQQLQKE